VDFDFIDRDFEQEKNELTPKGTYRRKVVENNFINFIKPMYERSYHSIRMNGNEIRIPNWFLRERGLTPDGIQVKNDKLIFKNISKKLEIKFKKNMIQVGNTHYKIQGKVLEFGKLLTDPVLWLGNEDLVEFSENKIFNWVRNEETREKIIYHSQVKPPKVDPGLCLKFKSEEGKSEVSLRGIHEATLILYQKNEAYSDAALDYFGTAIKEQDSEVIRYTLEILQRTLNTSSIGIQRKAFILLLNTQWQHESDFMYRAFLDKSPEFINTDVITQICRSGFSNKKLEILFQITRDYCSEGNKRGIKLFRLLSQYGALHPTRYKIIRQFLVSCQLADLESGFTRAARIARFECRDGFREWLGSTQEVAVDIETSEEYHWEDVIIFEESIDSTDKARLLSAIINTTLVREAVFLFSEGVLVRLNDIPPGGLWVSLLGKEHGKAVYRITIQTRFQGSFDIAVNVNHDISFAEILDEITWLIQAGTTAGDQKLVEDFGGYWDEYDLWSEEFIPGETAGKFISRMIRQQDQTMNERLSQIWPYFIWSGVSSYIQFWKRTERRLELDDPTPINIIIPKHDYQTGSRIVSISARRKHLDPLDMLKNFIHCYIKEIENQYGILKGVGKSKYLFSAIIEALGHKKGIAFLHHCIELLDNKSRKNQDKQLFTELTEYLSSVKEGGFIPKRLYFAIKRYHRWRPLSPSATNLARTATLSELYETYQLNLLEIEYPETRTRFFRDTVFAHSEKELRNGLKKIISEQQKGKIPDDRFTQHISALQKSIKLKEEDLLFLTRLSYPHLQPTDTADLISLEKGGISHTDIVVQTKDYEGDSFYIRGPVNPKEISRLHQLFLKNNLSVQFRFDHMYLVAVNERNQVIGGLFYKKNSEDTVHIEKIVVADFYRKKGVSDGLLREFFMRMKNEHYYFVTTGFFRPEYFYRFGFKVERKYAGLVKNLKE
jgi:GNAT superfamily N-acetyltransferase